MPQTCYKGGYNRNQVQWPASCPFVTAVGGTYTPQWGCGDCETAAMHDNKGNQTFPSIGFSPKPTSITSTGGYSTIFTKENGYDLSFQEAATTPYTQKHYPTGLNCRGVPDISANSQSYLEYVGGVLDPVAGTSAAAPAMAAIITQAYSGIRFGWINPLIYRMSALGGNQFFWDVTKGNNFFAKHFPCHNPMPDGAGFYCAEGWDPVTGVGSFGSTRARGAQAFLDVLRGGPSGPTCFPGDATVHVYGRGATRVASLSVGDQVLVESVAGKLKFEPVLAFLHKVPTSTGAWHGSLTVVHAHGTFRASENHVVFVVSEDSAHEDMPVSAVRPGDQLLVQSAGQKGSMVPSPVLAIGREITAAGMYAPFTSSGAIIVDGVVASNYGAPSPGMRLPHGAAHAAFFALRAYHNLDLGMLLKIPEGILRPVAKMMFHQVLLGK